MRIRLIAVAGALLLALPVMAESLEEEQDRAAGQLIFQIVKIMGAKSNLDIEAQSALGSSLEFTFLLLQRSRTRASAEALARIAVLSIDAGGGESKDEAILSKGAEMLPLLRKIPLEEYSRLCAGAMSAVCMSESDVRRYVADLSGALIHGRVVPD